MSKQCSDLAYALITPYSLLKSRTGGIIGRLLSLTNLELAGARMYTPSDEMLDRYCVTIEEQEDLEPQWKKALLNYINKTFRKKNQLGISNRTMMLLFEGKDAVRSLRDDVIGSFSETITGDTLRGTYGDYVAYPGGEVEFFEPAVLTAGNEETNYKQLKILAAYAESDGGIVDRVLTYPPGVKVETTLVIIKPDNFKRRSSRAGNIIDMYSRTGLYIVGAKLVRLSVAQAEEFYRPLRTLFIERLKLPIIEKLRWNLDGNFAFTISDEMYSRMADLLKEENARVEFNKIVKYMTGLDPDEVGDGPNKKAKPGLEKCLALLYQGEDAIRKIRDRLGATDPEKAADGTIRTVYGYDLMKNAAHASDSPENAEREGRIVGLWPGIDECDLTQIIGAHL